MRPKGFSRPGFDRRHKTPRRDYPASASMWPIRRFPYLIFYIEQPDALDVWRVLHGQRDIPAWIQSWE
jgi:hypothetical protein